MDATTKNLVRQRAGDCCEYCHLPQDATPFITFHIEHVIAKQHTPDDDNLDDLKRLALACDRCNLFKGPNLSSIDPNSGEIVNLFNPRTDNWNDHFATRDAKIVGLAIRSCKPICRVDGMRTCGQCARRWFERMDRAKRGSPMNSLTRTMRGLSSRAGRRTENRRSYLVGGKTQRTRIGNKRWLGEAA